MALTWEERESVTNDYFFADGGKACDIYSNSSFMTNYLLKQKKGLYRNPPGGEKIRVPVMFDVQNAAFYARGETISSDDREAVNAAYFPWIHAYSNATIYRIDTLANSGKYAEIELLTSRLEGAQLGLGMLIAGSFYDEPGGSANRLTGMRACCHETASLAYGNIAEDDLVSEDGTKAWEGKRDTTVEGITTTVLRTLASGAHVRDGANGDPDMLVTTRTLYNVILAELALLQRFTKEGGKTAKAGFTGIEFEGKELAPDDYMPSGYTFAFNTKYMGFAVHKDGNFVREPWAKVPDSAGDTSTKFYLDLNLIVNNRKAHKAHSALY